ncbi:MAG TPA: DUF349 domain-containing protein [Xanthomonadales bacterium]|nr:DUF349 domain-containing protein [Xanthomonadales bacterium]
MALFDSFKQPKWQHKNPEKRKQAVSELDDPQILLAMVCEDSDFAVQKAALERIDQPALLDELIGRKLAPPLLSQAKLQRLHQLVPQPEALETIRDEVALLHIIQLSENAELTAAAINRIENEQTLARLARQHSQARARLLAAQKIKSQEITSQLMQDSRGHDKAVFRHCKNLLDEAQAQEKAAAAQQDKIDRLLGQMADLARAEHSPVYEGQYRALVSEWRMVESTANNAQKAAFQENQAICGQKLIEQRDERLEAERNQAEVAAAQLQFTAIVQSLDELEANITMPTDETGLEQFSQVFKQLELRWLEASKTSPATPELETPFKARMQRWRMVSNTLGKLLEKAGQAQALLDDAKRLDGKNHSALEKQVSAIGKFLARLPWPESIQLDEPELIIQLRNSQQQLRQQLHALEQEQPKLVKRLSELTDAITAALDQQHPGDADKAMSKARKLLHSLATQRRQEAEQSLAPLSARLHEFHDWQNFAIEPKKEALCERMSALVGQDDDVELLALNIQLLQAEWKQLGPLPHAREQELWTRFKAAADEAWKPCKQEFAQQAEIRRQNFQARMQLVEQLKAYEAQMQWPEQRGEGDTRGPVPDWPLVQKTLDAARAAFKSTGPVEPKAERTSQKAFKEICDRVYGHIRAEYQRNIDRKEDLAARALKLTELDDLHQAINSVKLLQADWTAVGMTPVAVDRKLWKQFRASCDAVFARLDQQRQAEKQETDAQVQQAESLRDQARALLANPDPDHLAHLPRSIAELKDELAAINLPHPVKQALAKQMQAMESQARDLLSAKQKEAEKQAWTNLSGILVMCATRDAAEPPGSGVEEMLNNLPKGIDAQIIEAFVQQGPDAQADEQCREACIALEVSGGIDSPVEDKQARMNYQLGRLTQGLGSQVVKPEQDLLEKINAFIALHPAQNWVERFCSCLQQIRT